jgi:tetratricopeptide (TPR) repeat protein
MCPRFDSALVCNASGLELESDHPDLWSQRGYINLKLQRFEEALRCYERATQVRSWASARQLARAYRGIGVALVDLQRLEHAEVALKRSLEFEPESEAAISEIEYINNLRLEREEARKNLPWFVGAYLHPPTDPLTIRLLKITDGLPQLNGPEVVGTKNYAAIAKAFMERGWAGFEEAFGSLFPRTHPDHEQIKRGLLCEAIFRPEVHRRMTLMLTGKMDIEDVHREQQQARKQRVD